MEEVGPSLKYATAKVARVQRSGGGGGYGSSTGGEDPWATAPAQSGGQSGLAQGGQPAQGGGQAWGGQQGGQAAPGGQPQQNDPWATGGSDEPPF